MASEEKGLEKDMVFLALTRPTMVLGVTYSWFALEGFGWLIYFINMKDFLGVFLGATATHLIGYLILSREPRLIEMWKVWGATCNKCRNKRFHGNTDSYDLT